MDRLTLLQIHGWLMWISIGFLFPLGVIIMRFNRTPSGSLSNSKAKNLMNFHLHMVIQVIGVILAIAGIVILLVQAGPKWDYTHQRLGLALFIITLALPIAGFFRPKKGSPLRPYFFIFHWGLGTALVFLGIVNCYIGIHAYQIITKHSLRSLNIAFSIQVTVMALIWVLQDTWKYIKEQFPSVIRSDQATAEPHQIGPMTLP